MSAPTNLDAALAYAQRGWHVFPVGAWDPAGDPAQPKGTPARDAYDRAKRPLSMTPGGAGCCSGTHAHAKDDATTDTALIRRWWTAHPDARIGYNAARSGLAVVDDDSYGGPNPKKAGRAPLPAPRPKTLTVLTPSDGRQELFVAPPGCSDSNFQNGEVLHNRYGILPSPGSGYRFEDPSVDVSAVDDVALEAALFFGGAGATYDGPAPEGAELEERRAQLEAFLASAGITGYKVAARPNGGIFAALDECPFGDHGDSRSAWVGRHPSGAWVAGCHHNGCGGQGSENRWAELREMVEGPPELATFDINEAVRWVQVIITDVEKGIVGDSFLLDELMAINLPDVQWVVPDYIPEGLTLLGGPPKLGKSWFVLDLAISVTSGRRFLDMEIGQGPALYLALEDNPRRLQRRAGKLLAGMPAPKGLRLKVKAPSLAGGLVADIREWLESDEAAGARLVVLDTLGRVQDAGEDGSDGGYKMAIRDLAQLQQLAADWGVAIVVITHTRKGSGEASDPLESILGSQGLAGTADSIIVLRRPRADTVGELFVTGREIETEQRLAVTFNTEACRWEVGDVNVDYPTLVLKVCQEEPFKYTLPEMARKLRVRDEVVRAELAGLEAAGKVHKQKRPGKGGPMTYGANPVPNLVPTSSQTSSPYT